MDIHVNGRVQTLPGAAANVAALIDAMALAGKRIAVEVNGAIVPRSRYAETPLAEGDRVEVVGAVGGG